MLLITGGAGYIGSHTVLEFLKDNKEILIFDNLENGHIETVETLKELGNVTFEQGDLKNFQEIDRIFDKYEIEGVIHFAAYALVCESVQNPQKYYENNVFGTLNLLNAMKNHDVKNIVFSSTCATFGEPIYVPIDENHPQKPINPYGQSKLMVEKILADYDKAYNLKYIALRYFNVAGCDHEAKIGEWHEPETHLIPNILKSALKKKPTFEMYGDKYETPDGTCIRDYVNVLDLANAHKLAYDYLKTHQKSDIFNLGTENGNSVKEILIAVEKILNQKVEYIVKPNREGDPAKLFANSSKAKEILKWQPQYTIEDSILSAYKWEQKL